MKIKMCRLSCCRYPKKHWRHLHARIADSFALHMTTSLYSLLISSDGLHAYSSYAVRGLFRYRYQSEGGGEQTACALCPRCTTKSRFSFLSDLAIFCIMVLWRFTVCVPCKNELWIHIDVHAQHSYKRSLLLDKICWIFLFFFRLGQAGPFW